MKGATGQRGSGRHHLRIDERFANAGGGEVREIVVESRDAKGLTLPVERGAEPNHIAVPFRAFDDVDLQFLVSQLPEPDRTAARLRIEEKELEEIAVEMQLSVKKVRTILARVRKRLWLLVRDP